MSEERFLDRLREDARQLQYEPADDALWTRLAARVRDRINEPTVIEILARWFRPLAASVAVIAIVASVGFTLFESSDPAMNADEVQITMAGETYSVGE